MSQRAELVTTSIKLSLFLVLCLAATLWLAFTIGNIRLFQGTYQLSATFDDATGLVDNDSVKIAGVVVGKVTGVEVDRGRAKVNFEVNDDVVVPSNSAASIRWRNLLGQRYVYLEPPAEAAPTTLGDGDVVAETVSPIDLGELFNRLGPIIAAIDPARVNTFLDAVDGALSGNEGDLRSVIADLADVTTVLADRDVAIGRLVANLDTLAGTVASREAQIRTMLDNLVLIATTFNTNTDVLDDAITELGDFSDHLAALLSGNRDHIDGIIESLEVVVGVVADHLDDLDIALGGLDETARSLFNAGRYGTWLNQIIPCGQIGPAAIELTCDDTGLDGVGPAGAPPPARGASTIESLIGTSLGRGATK